MPRLPARRRRAAALVEFAFVVSVFLLMLFGILEYARLVFTQQVMMNAAREGARWAVVNSTDANLVTDTQAVVTKYLSGVAPGATISVYAADSSGNNIGTPTTVQFGSLIGVQIDYDYKPIVPVFLHLNNTIHLTIKSYMYSESN